MGAYLVAPEMLGRSRAGCIGFGSGSSHSNDDGNDDTLQRTSSITRCPSQLLLLP